MTPTSFTAGKGLGFILRRLIVPGGAILLLVILKNILSFSGSALPYLDTAVFFFAVVLAIRLIDAVLIAWYEGRRKPYPLPDVLRGMILAALYLVLFFVVLDKLRVDIKPLLTGSAILTAVLGLAFQGVLSNILSGMSLHFTHSFSRGDWVGIGKHEGVVVDTNWRETRLLDRSTNIVVLPNNAVASETITNFSKPDVATALTLTFKIGYDAPVVDVVRALLDAAQECPQVMSAPKPQAYITSYDEFGVSYLLKFWVKDFAQKNSIIGEVGRLAWYKMRRDRIDIALSLGDRIREVVRTVRQVPAGGPAPEAEAGEKEKTYADLRHSAFLRPSQGEQAGRLIVSDEDLRTLADLVRRSVYTKGEIVFRQGERGTSCYVVAKGRIRGEIATEEGGKRYVSEFVVEPEGIFGEMSLFTGMPRTATGIVAEEAELLEIKAEDFAVLIERNPVLAEAIAEIVSVRNEENKDLLRKIKDLSEKDIADGTNKKTILEYLKRFVHGLKK
ncbi:MAG: mechanosensitive ion channel family protein [Candidatus Aminicenantes bacterium]|nr:mechanosensitive ion channel family protein [Candidatus Aminicenantes bacterium]